MKYDLIIIGAGPGGYEAAVYAGKNGLKTLLIEKAKLGGVCLNSGCIPTKTILASIHQYKLLKSSRTMGITADNISLEFNKVIERKDRLVSRLITGIEMQLKEAGVDIVHGEASLSKDKKVIVQDKEYQSKNIIIATGSKPVELEGIEVDHKKIFNSTSILNLQKLPASITIAGCGYIGLEFAEVFSSSGVKVKIVEMMDKILPHYDQEAVELVVSKLKKQGCEFHLDTKFKLEEDSSDIVLCAAGRRSFSDNFKAQVNLGKRNEITVNENFQTSLENVYAIGDVNHQAMLAHAATYQGLSVVDLILGKIDKIEMKNIPSVMFTSPQIAAVGDISGKDHLKAPFMMLGKAQAENQTEGFIKLFTDKDKVIKGVTIASDNADALIGEALILIEKQVTVEELKKTVHPHPTLSEIFFEAVKHG